MWLYYSIYTNIFILLSIVYLQMCLFPTLLYWCIVIISHGVADGQCVDIVLLQALFYRVILKHSDLFKVIAVYFSLLF